MKKLIFVFVYCVLSGQVSARDTIGNMIHHSFDASIEYTSLEDIQVTLPDAKKYNFTLTKDLTYISDNTWVSLENSQNSFIVNDTRSDIHYIFSQKSNMLNSLITADGREWKLVYQDDVLQYVTDGQTQTYFFYYDSGGKLVKIENSSSDAKIFSYIQIREKYYLSKISSQNTTQYIEYDEFGNVVGGLEKLDMNFQTDINKGIIYAVSSTGAVQNADSSIQYKMIGDTLYSLQDMQKIFLIDTQAGTRKLLYSGTGIDDFYITDTAQLYIQKKGKIYRYDAQNKKLIEIFSFPQIHQFVVDDKQKKIYFISSLYPGYYSFDTSNKNFEVQKSDRIIVGISIQDSQIFITDEITKQDNIAVSEFGSKYALKIDELLHRRKKYVLTDRQISQLLVLLERKKGEIFKNISDSYKKEELKFIFDMIKQAINN